MNDWRDRAIAIVGIGCRFPGGVSDPAGFWQLLCEGRSGIGPIPNDRFDVEHYVDPEPRKPGRTVATAGGYLDHIDGFDAAFFGISPHEAERLDPQQRLLLETAWEAIEDSGSDAAKLERRHVGVFVGQWISDFEARLHRAPEDMDFYMTLGSGRYASAGRIAYAFDFMGPTVSIDAACSSSLVAVHLAVQSLRSGEVGMALAGGVNVILEPHIHIAYSQSGMMAPDARCKFGDAKADGYVRSEGAAVVALKTLDQAEADGDRIYAVIRGSAVNHDGRESGSMGRPSVLGQKDLLSRAYRDAGISPSDVGYIEAHGTGTRAGDAVELQAISEVLGEGRAKDEPLLVGSVKTNIGHCEGAAGIAGLIKAALVVREGFVPPSLNLEQPNPRIPWSEYPISIPQRGAAWDGSGPRRAGVGSFGISGTNAHVVLEEPPPVRELTRHGEQLPLLLLSARSDTALREMARRLAESLGDAPSTERVADLVAFSQSRCTSHAHRAVFLADDPAHLIAALIAFSTGGAALAEGTADPRDPAKVAFVFPGQGGQWKGMARELLARSLSFRDTMRRADDVIRAETGWSLIERLHEDTGSEIIERIDVVQPALAAISIAYAAWLREHGVDVAAVAGHSMGEAAASHVAGAISLDDALRIVCRRSRLMLALSGKGAMALVDLPEAEVKPALARFAGRVSIAAVNSPQACVVSGDKEPVAKLVEEFTARGAFSRLINVDVASHSPQMEAPSVELCTQLADMSPAAAKVPFVSSVMGRLAEGSELDAGYWARNLRQTVRFANALACFKELGVSAVVELGPHPVLTPSIERSGASRNGRPLTVVCCGRRDESDEKMLLLALSQLWCAGAAIDWSRNATSPAKVVDFPRYPWQRERYWVENAELQRGPHSTTARRRIPEEHRQWLHRVVWREMPTASVAQTKPATAGAAWTVIGDAPELVQALSVAGAGVSQVQLSCLEARLAAVGESRQPANVLLVAPSGEEAPLLSMRVARSLPAGAAVRLWFATRGARAPAGLARTDAEQAALWGAARVFASERPDIWGGLIDLPSGNACDQASAQEAASRLLDPRGEDQIAIRGAQAFVPRLVSAAEEPGAAVTWRNDGAYLITGGLGDVGLSVAAQLVDEGVRRLILAGRSGLPPRRAWSSADRNSRDGKRIAAVREIERRGAAVHIAAVDVSDEAALREFLAGYEEEGWPPIIGVLHLAASLDRRLSEKFTPESFQVDMRSKLRSAQILDRLLPELDTFILFSSQITLIPQPGMSAYAAANAGLEALAIDRRARGVSASAVVWGHWHGAGLISGDIGDIVTRELDERGLKSFAPSDAAAMLSFAAGRDEPVMSVISVDWAAYSAHRGGMREPLLSEVMTSSSGAAAGDRLALAAPAERNAILASMVIEALSRTLRIPADRISPTTPFGSMGLTSILAMELRNRLERELSRPLSVTLAWNYPTVEALSAFLAGERKEEKEASPITEPEPVLETIDLASAITGGSDADVLDALRRPRRSRAIGR